MLIDAFMAECARMERTAAPDSIGGSVNGWAEGKRFTAAIVKNDTLQARIAEKQGVTELYTVTYQDEITLGFHDVFKRLSDGATFRVTSNPVDSPPPPVASFSFSQLTAERWDLA